MTYEQAVAAYVEKRREFDRIETLSEAAFMRWFNGEVKSAQAATRLANRLNYLSADLYAAESAVYDAADHDDEIDFDKLNEEASCSAS